MVPRLAVAGATGNYPLMRAYGWFHVAVVAGPVIALLTPWFRSYVRYWRPFVLTLGAVSLPWMLLDAYSHQVGWWSYHPAAISGTRVIGLPIEEILFFLTVPFACLSLWLAISGVFGSQVKWSRGGWLLLGAAVVGVATFLGGGIAGWERTTLDGALLLVSSALVWRSGLYRRHAFWVWSLAVAGLFLVFNAFLTGIPIVLYNEAVMSGWRIGTIPIEDALYNFAFLWMCIVGFERFRLLSRQ